MHCEVTELTGWNLKALAGFGFLPIGVWPPGILWKPSFLSYLVYWQPIEGSHINRECAINNGRYKYSEEVNPVNLV